MGSNPLLWFKPKALRENGFYTYFYLSKKTALTVFSIATIAHI
jgi:hypothetical protein